MKDTLFIQFYSKTKKYNLEGSVSFYEVDNGFSDTWDLCKSKGDFLWVNLESDESHELPIQVGTAYVSVCYLTHLYRTYEWAIRYPNINFIAGGPATNPNKYQVDDSLIPKNLNIITCTVEEYFNVPNFSYPWKLELPTDESENDALSFMYTLSNICYWNKCIFCSFSDLKLRKRPEIKFGFKNVTYSGHKTVNLYSPSISPIQLDILLSNLTYDEKTRYDIFIRADKEIREVLKKVLIKKQKDLAFCKFFLGVEFPSNRMLKHMKKNNTVEDFLETINVLSEYGDKKNLIMHLPFILRWNNLESSDILELDKFLNKLDSDKARFVFSIYPIEVLINTPIYNNNMYEIEQKLYVGPFYYGFKPRVSKNQINLSKQALELLNNQKIKTFDYSGITMESTN